MHGRKFIQGWLIALLAALLCAPAATASLPSTYKATIEGSIKTTDTAVDTGLVYKGLDTIKVTGLKFKRVRVSKKVDPVSAGYKITAGKVTWTSTMTGGCQYSYSESFPISSVNDGSDRPLQFDKFSGRWKMFAEIDVTKSATINKLCIFNDGSTGEVEGTLDLPRLLFSGGSTFPQKPASKIKRTFYEKYSDKSSSYSATWKLSLKS